MSRKLMPLLSGSVVRALQVHYAYARQRMASRGAVDNHPVYHNYSALARAVTWA